MKKLILFLVVIVMVFCTIGCSHDNSREISYITDESSWFTSNYSKMDENTLSIDTTIPIYFDSNVKMYYQFAEEENSCSNLVIYRNGESQSRILDLNKCKKDGHSLVGLEYAFESNYTYFVCISENVGADFKHYIYELDLDSLELKNEIDIEFKREYSNLNGIKKCINKEDKTYIEFYYDNDGIYRNGYKVIDRKGATISEFAVENRIINWSIFDDGDILCISENNKSDSNEATKINYQNQSAEELTIPEAVLSRIETCMMFDTPSAYFQNEDMTITKYDFASQKEDVVFDYNYCDANLNDLCSSFLINCEDDKNFFFIKNEFFPGEEESYNVTVDITKAESNPHVGKQILFVAASNGFDYMTSEAIRKFNETNQEYFCYGTMKYSMYSDSVLGDNFLANRDSTIYQLRQDIEDGTGPDILLDFGEYSNLQNDRILVNVNPMLRDYLSSSEDEFFENDFDAFTYDNQLYFVPLSASAEGICTASIEDKTKEGFTYSEYEDYVLNSWENLDPMKCTFSKNSALEYMMAYLYSQTHIDGRLSIDNDSFRQMCEYVATFPDKSEYKVGNASVDSFISLSSNLTGKLSSEEMIYGFPSDEVRGPGIRIHQSASITKCCSNEDIAWDFIEELLSYDIQINQHEYNPINVRAFDAYAKEALEYGNKFIKEQYGQENYYDETVIDNYKKCLYKAKVPMMTDTTTMVVINEEIAAYFEHQKSIDEIIPIIENRVNNMLQEQG